MASKKISQTEETVPVISGEEYRALQGEAQELRALIEESLEDGLREDDLEQIKIPTGGGLQWELPNGENVASFSGVIVGIQTTRSYWPDAFTGGSTPPQCSSKDGILGQGDPGGECETCPHNHWGTGRNGKGTACSERKRLYVLRPEDEFPTILSLPITSAKFLRKYRVAVIKQRHRLHEVVTQFSLLRDKNAEGIVYSHATFASLGALPPALSLTAKAYAKTIQAAMGIARQESDSSEPAAPRDTRSEEAIVESSPWDGDPDSIPDPGSPLGRE